VQDKLIVIGCLTDRFVVVWVDDWLSYPIGWLVIHIAFLLASLLPPRR